MTTDRLAEGARSDIRAPDGTRLAVYEWGKPDGPEVLLIHGFAQCHLCFEPQIRALARSCRVVAYDQRGHGASDQPTDPAAYQGGRVWADDIAAVIETKQLKRPVIVGWSMADHMETDLVSDALKMALHHRQPDGDKLVHHSDRGVQYASDDYQHLLARRGITCSMSGHGDCYDNAMMESFWATLKTELVHHRKYATREQARQSIFEYVEVFYNRKRLHSSLGYVSPESFEAAA